MQSDDDHKVSEPGDGPAAAVEAPPRPALDIHEEEEEEEEDDADDMEEVQVDAEGERQALHTPEQRTTTRRTHTYQQLQEVDRQLNPAQFAKVVGRWWVSSLASGRFFPPATWVRTYTRQRLFGDMLAGLTVAVMLVPQGLAYSALAGFPPVYGLYSSFIPLILFTLFTTSMKTAVGPNAPISILMVSAMAGLPAATQADYIRLALTMTFVSGLVQIVLSLLRAGVIVNLLSWPVKTGYMAGAALLIMASQLQDTFGVIMVKNDNFFIHVVRLLIALPTTNWRAVCFSFGSLLVLLSVKRIPKLPSWFPTPLLVIVITLLVSWGTNAGSYGVKIVGNVPMGLPAFQVPFQSVDDIVLVIPAAISVAFVAFAGSISLELSFAKDAQEVDANQELMAFGIASTIGSMCSSFVPSGAFSRTAVNAQAGATSPLANTFTASFILVALMLLAQYLKWLPMAVLAAIILSAAVQIIKIEDFKTLWRTSPMDFWQAIITMVVVLIWGMQVGIAVGVGLAVAMLIVQSIFPRILVLGHVPDRPDVFVAVGRYPEVQEIPQLKIVRIDSSLNFANVGTFSTKLRVSLLVKSCISSDPASLQNILSAAANETSSEQPLVAVILDCIRVVDIDATACQHLKSLLAAFQKANVQLLLTGAPAPLRARLRKFGLNNIHFYLTVLDAVRVAVPAASALSIQYCQADVTVDSTDPLAVQV